MPAFRQVVIANPGSLRWLAYEQEFVAYCHERGVEPDLVLVPWRDVVEREGDLTGVSAFDAPGAVRLESPGRDWDVTRRLLGVGCRAVGETDDFQEREYRKGLLLRPGLLYEGFRRVLTGLRQAFDARPGLTPTCCPLEIAEMFDKTRTSARLAAAGLPVPASIAPPTTSEGLLYELRERRWPTAYVKLNTGSSASGIAVVRPLADPVTSISSVVELNGEFWSTRRLARHEGEGLHRVLTFLLGEGVCVQRGVRMAQLDGQNFDIRVVMIGGEPAFTVFRLSHQPMTNLHLGGCRGDLNECRAAVPVRAWLDALDDCRTAASLYRSAMMGIDLVFENGYQRHAILEVNAFGDFFPNLTDDRGRSVHRVEIERDGPPA